MRAARIALALAFLGIGVACLVPSNWLTTEQTPRGNASGPPDVTAFVFVAACGYFLGAALFPRLRPRWSWHQGVGAKRTRSGVQTFATKARGPRMSALTCCGIAIGLGGLAWLLGPQTTWARKLPAGPGLGVSAAGAVIAVLGVFFTRGRGATTTTDLRTGKTIKRRGYYED